MDTLGQVFKDIRTSRKISLEKATGGLFSSPTLSRFENGENEISAQKLLLALENIHMDLDEFMFICRSYQPHPDDLIQRRIMEALDPHDPQSLKDLYQEEYDLYQKTKKESHRLHTLHIKARLTSFDDDSEVTQEELDFLHDYLFSVERWGRYELQLFSTCSTLLSPQLYITYVKEMFARTDFQQTFEANRRFIHILLVNGIFLCTQAQEFEMAHYIDRQIQKYFFMENETYIRIVYLFAKGFLTYSQGEEEKGQEKMEEALQVFRILECNDSLTYYQDVLEEMLQKEKKG